MEVSPDQEPGEGEVLLFTAGGGFSVKGSVHDVVQQLSNEDWPHFELSESGDTVVIRSSQVVAVRGGSTRRRGAIGFMHRD